MLAFFAVGVWYLIWRLGTFNPEARFFSWLLWAAEAFGFLTSCLFLFSVWTITQRTSPPAPRAQDGPTVDVLVPTCGEPLAIVRRTLLCARRMGYPHETWLLDDADRPEMRELAQDLGVHYLSRQERRHAKAGNLNEGMKHTRGQLLAVFDADHCPTEDFLTRTLGWFADPTVAFVQTAHEFYNLDSFQHCARDDGKRIWHEQTLFYKVIQRGKDRWNAAFFCGSGAVLRRSALEQIGGFATDTITEDMHTSVRLHKAGWKSIYLPEPLAYGIAPQTMGRYTGQRLRWALGNMQVWWRENVVFGRGLSLAQRLCYLSSILCYLEGWQKAVLYATPLLVLLAGIMPVVTVDWLFMAHFIPFYALSVWAFVEASRGHGWYMEAEQFGMCRFATFLYASVGWILRRPRFRVTAKSQNRREGAGLWLLLPHWAVLLLSLIAIPVGVLACAPANWPPWRAVVISSIWAMLNASLAWGVVLSARRAGRCRRGEYRFPTNWLLRIRHDSGEIAHRLRDLSPQGFHCQGPIWAELAVGSTLVGEIDLPSAPIAFEAIVRHVSPGDRTTADAIAGGIRCQFRWPDDTPPAALELSLYGTGQQWTTQAISDHAPTPLAALLAWRSPRPELQPAWNNSIRQT